MLTEFIWLRIGYSLGSLWLWYEKTLCSMESIAISLPAKRQSACHVVHAVVCLFYLHLLSFNCRTSNAAVCVRRERSGVLEQMWAFREKNEN